MPILAPSVMTGFISTLNINWGSMSAAAVLTILPTVVLFALASKWIVQGLTLQVLKIRGSHFLTGRHSYRLSPRGFEVFPRLADPLDASDYEEDVDRISSGVETIDAMLADGFWRGSSTLLAGPSGIGKTLLASHFIFAGAARGEPGVIATFQENPVQLKRYLHEAEPPATDARHARTRSMSGQAVPAEATLA